MIEPQNHFPIKKPANLIKRDKKVNTVLPREYFPLSPLQNGMIRESLESPPGAGAYIEQIVFTVNQNIDIKRFTTAWLKIIQHHEIIRLGFEWKNKQPLQYVAVLDEINIEFNDWSKKSEPETDEFLAMFLQADRRLGFSLDNPPVFRMALLKTDETQYTCILSFHHAIADKRTMVTILKDLFLTYQNPNIELTPPGSFKNYVLWLNAKRSNTRDRKFWQQQLKGVTSPLYLPFLLKESIAKENKRQKHSIRLTTKSLRSRVTSDITAELVKFCSQNAITINFLLMGAWAILLSHYSGENNIVFGVTRSIRQWRGKGTGDTGMYANTLPVRIQIDPKENFSSFLNKIRNNWVVSKEFEHNSPSDILAWDPAAEGRPLFDILFSYNENSMDAALKDQKEKISCSKVSLLERTPGSLFLTINGIDELLITIAYDRRRFETAAIKQIMGHFITCLESIVQIADPKLMDISILTDPEKKDINQRLNTFKPHVKPDSSVHHLINIQASSNKDTTAVCDQTGSLTYGELNIFSSQIAHYLINLGAAPEKNVVLLLEQDRFLIAAILGVLKSGSAYVPIDPNDPDERINCIIEHCTPKIIITSQLHKPKIHEKKPIQKRAVILQLNEEMDRIRQMDAAMPKTEVTPENTAYIIYTSSSTGHPKGIMVTHSSLVAFTRSASEIYDIRPDDRILQFASISVDTAAGEIFPTLFSGATLVMEPRRIIHSPSQLFNFSRENSLTVLDLPTFFWHMIVKQIGTLAIPEQIRLIIISGEEETNSDKVQKWDMAVNSGIRLINTYGPPEATITVTSEDITSGSGSSNGKVSIGLPFPTVSLCILNQFQQPALPGTMGELYIGGPQISRGYLNNPSLTKKYFVRLKAFHPESFFFKTGDRVKMLQNNGIHFYGRIDSKRLVIPKLSQGYVETPFPKPEMPPRKMINPQSTAPKSSHPQRNKTPIILVGNSVESAQAYKRANLAGHPFYHAPIFIHFYAEEKRKTLSLDIKQLAQKCIADILTFFPKGPYIIMGSCQNSIVAHEIACQLTDMKHMVELLVIIDENWNRKEKTQNIEKSNGRISSFLKKQSHEINTFGILYIFKKLILKTKNKIRYYFSYLDEIRERLYIATEKPVPEAIQFRSMENIFYKACESNPYTPIPYSGRVLLFYSNGWVDRYAPKLNTFFKGEIKKINVKTPHSRWFKPESIKRILQGIEDYSQ